MDSSRSGFLEIAIVGSPWDKEKLRNVLLRRSHIANAIKAIAMVVVAKAKQ